MPRPRNLQEWLHWLELGGGARAVRLAALTLGVLVVSLLVSWSQFRGATNEATLAQADTGRQLAAGQGFTTLVNTPQTVAFLERRGVRFDPARPEPELYQAPLYSLVIAGALRVLPEAWREALFARAPVAPNGFAADYFLLGLNLILFWLAAWLTAALGRRLFDARTGMVAALAVLVSVGLWQATVRIDGTPLLMVLALLAFHAWHRADTAATPRAALAWMAGLGAVGGLLFLTEYSAGALVVVALGYALLRFAGRERWLAAGLVALGFLVVAGPWMGRNLALTGSPVGLALQNVALRTGDLTAEPAAARLQLSADLPALELGKLGNKTLTGLQENLKSRLWSGGGMWLTAFFVAGWLYTYRSAPVNRLRWTLAAALVGLIVAQSACNSGESERLAAIWIAPVIVVFGAGFFFVLLGSNPVLGAWPRGCATVLLLLQALPLLHDALEPRRLHFSYPPYAPGLLLTLHQELARRGAETRFGVMADVPAGVAWYGRQRTWAQPLKLRDFYAITLEQPVGELLLTPRTLDRPFFTDLAAKSPNPVSLARARDRFGEWGGIYAGLLSGVFPPEFPLGSSVKLDENLYVLLNPALPPPR